MYKCYITTIYRCKTNNGIMKLCDIWDKICNLSLKAWDLLKKNATDGIKWAGTDGILNMETGALLTIFLGIFIPTMWAMFISFAVMIAKCSVDEKHGHKDETHDLVCASVGAVIGAILLIAL